MRKNAARICCNHEKRLAAENLFDIIQLIYYACKQIDLCEGEVCDMGFMKKVCGKLGLTDASEMDELLEEELSSEETDEKAAKEEIASKTAASSANTSSGTPLPSNVVDLQAALNGGLRSRMKVVVIEPKSFDDVQQVANCLKEKMPVIINFEHTDAEEAHRIIDFISGATYAIAGDIKKAGHNVFLCVPNNVSVSYTQERGSLSTDISWLKK